MSDYTVTKTRLFAGVWEGVITGGGEQIPEIEVSHLGETLDGVKITASDKEPGEWVLQITIAARLLCDGVQVFVISERGSGEKLTAFTIVTGEPLEDDIRAEVELLRAELDMLKRAFRRHCLETP